MYGYTFMLTDIQNFVFTNMCDFYLIFVSILVTHYFPFVKFAFYSILF